MDNISVVTKNWGRGQGYLGYVAQKEPGGSNYRTFTDKGHNKNGHHANDHQKWQLVTQHELP